MEYRVELTARALAEADRARDWIAQASPERASRWYQGLLDAIASLSSHPRRCPLDRENADFAEELRQLLYGRRRGVYRVLFTIRMPTKPPSLNGPHSLSLRPRPRNKRDCRDVI